MLHKKYTLLFFLSFYIFLGFSQEVNYAGKVQDSLGLPVVQANVTAIPENKDLRVQNTSTNEQGNFLLVLKSEENYTLLIGHLAYQSFKSQVTIKNNFFETITLTERVEALEEIIINYTPNIIIKKDTTTYDADAFRTGEERKVRELLKKMPGLEVDKEGNVTTNGKKVTKLLVDNKTFFTGSTKMGVNNIPADVVDKIEILENYSSVSFLKGLEDSEEIALNIKLKKDKNKFAFGDIEVGSGYEDRYLVHPTLFYYSPKTKVNFIGDLNNSGQQSFTMSDYLEFEGGFSKLMGNSKSYSEVYNSEFSKYLNNTDFKENTNRFGAFNLRQAISSKTDLNAYVIANASDTETEIRAQNEYSNNNIPFNENRATNNNLNNLFVIGKASLEYSGAEEDLKLNTLVKLTNNNTNGNIVSNSLQQNNVFNTVGSLDGVSLKQNLSYDKKIAKKHTLSTELTLAYKKETPNINWNTNSVFLADLIPLVTDDFFNITQEKIIENTSLEVVAKHYWVLNNYNHVYTSAGSSIVSENFHSSEEQILTNGTINNFSDNGFGNAMAYRFNDAFLGIEYKFLTGIFTIKPAAVLHHYTWQNTQFNTLIKNNTAVVLPALIAEAELSSSEKFRFKYDANVRFPNSNGLTRNFLLSDFNSVFRGNADLSFARYHNFFLGYNKYNLYRGFTFNAFLSYNKKTQSIKSATELQGIEQFRTLTMFNLPENGITNKIIFTKKISKIKLGVDFMANYNEFFQIVNGTTSKNTSKSLNLTNTAKIDFKKIPTVELGYSYKPSEFSTNVSSTTFSNNEFFVNARYEFLKDFTWEADYSKTNFTNENAGINNVFDIANTSLFYQKEDSPWGFELEATNLFDIKFRQDNTFTDFLISTQSTFVMPRIVMFKVSYKL
jgi:hypothetical protein